MMFLSQMKRKGDPSCTLPSSKYKRLLKRVVRKIDNWHVKQSELRKGTFEKDSEFMDLAPSPSRFSNSSSDSDEDVWATTSLQKTKETSKSKDNGLVLELQKSEDATDSSSPLRRKARFDSSNSSGQGPQTKTNNSDDAKMSKAKLAFLRVKKKRSNTQIIQNNDTIQEEAEGEGDRKPSDEEKNRSAKLVPPV